MGGNVTGQFQKKWRDNSKGLQTEICNPFVLPVWVRVKPT